jgi:hypothetical protein
VLYFVKSLLILLDTACWYGSTAVAIRHGLLVW